MHFLQLHQSIKDALAAVNDPTSDPDDDTSQMSEDMTEELSATVCQPSTLETDNELSSPTPPNLTQKRKKSQSTDSIELEKLKVLQEMSNAFQTGRSRPAADSDSTFGAQVTEELSHGAVTRSSWLKWEHGYQTILSPGTLYESVVCTSVSTRAGGV
ncbi:unnamed protein product [Leuciscus chuanchicus]